jgi:hypothetical protein
MIESFEPFMTDEKVATFQGYLAEIAAASEEIADLRAEVEGNAAFGEGAFDTAFPSAAALAATWPAIDEDMSDLVARMERNVDSYAAVAALPPFPLFPWFFVLPGVLIALVAGTMLWSQHRGRAPRRRAVALIVLGVGLIAAPIVFQMFGRAPQGRDMIDDFRPMMTTERVQAVQGYFITMGAAEGQLRAQVLPALEAAGGDVAAYTAIAQLSADWPTIVGDFNPMVAAMSDNLDNFAAVDALPRFDLFPWFFVLPGLILVVLAVVALRSTRSGTPSPVEDRLDPVTAEGDST